VCHYAECLYTECRDILIVMLKVVIDVVAPFFIISFLLPSLKSVRNLLTTVNDPKHHDT
jgi:hypothetical protein